ncbi:hypothetical protein GW17_00000166 [Ensete ventricosum]|nr:hypothetical protein GW17_00000166 [Ensete ventricosum]
MVLRRRSRTTTRYREGSGKSPATLCTGDSVVKRRQGSSIVTDASPRACRARLPQSGLGASHEEKPRGLRCLVWRAGGNTKPSSTHSRLSCYCHQIISYLQRLIPLSRHLRPYLPIP